MESRRLLLAALLSAVVLIAWNYMIMSLRPPEEDIPPLPSETLPGETAPPSETGPPEGTASEGTEPTGELPAFEEPAAEAETIDFSADEVGAVEESRSVIENQEIRAEFTNRGAQLVSFQLKKAAGGPLELVRPRGTDPYPFALVVGGDRSHRLNSALFEVDRSTDEAGLETLRFRHRSDRGAAEKVFRWTAEGLIEAQVTVLGSPGWGLVFGPGVRKVDPGDKQNRFIDRMAAYRRQNGESDEYRPGKVKEDVLLSSSLLNWVSLEDNFFLSAVLPRQGLREVLIRPVLQRAEAAPDVPRFLPLDAAAAEDLSPELLVLLQASGERMDVLAFFGSKRYRRLSSLPYHLEETVRWGFFGFFARPLYYALEWIHNHIVANYGWAIALVTVLIRLIFLPLTYKSQESMTKMQELNPKIQAIRQKYRGKLKNKQGRPNLDAHRAMQEEQSTLLREAGVNPMASCLPLLLQMPVFFAFFRLLSTAVELRGAPWLLWVRDLSTPDPYYILPILMGVTSIAMQRMMPSGTDPLQRRMMQLMPIMFTFFALAFPSGLVLYWVTNNLLSMAQQALMLKLKQRKAS